VVADSATNPACGASCHRPPGYQRNWVALLALAALLCGSGGALLSRAALLASDLTPLQSATVPLRQRRWCCAVCFATWPLQGLGAAGPDPLALVLVATLLGPAPALFFRQPPCSLRALGGGRWLRNAAPVMALPLARLEGEDPVGPVGWLPCWPSLGRQFGGGAGRPAAGRGDAGAAWALRPLAEGRFRLPAQRSETQRCGDLLKLEGGALAMIQKGPAQRADRLVEESWLRQPGFQLLLGWNRPWRWPAMA